MKLPPDQVLFRFVWPWRVFSAIPATVVELTPARTALWIAPGTRVRWPSGQRVAIAELRAGEWAHEEAEWYGGRLMLHERDAAHSVYVQWGRTGEFLGWYVNLEEPWRETALGFDTTDHLLDIWIDPDRSWRWKDEDHLAEAVEVGLFTREQADGVRAKGNAQSSESRLGSHPSARSGKGGDRTRHGRCPRSLPAGTKERRLSRGTGPRATRARARARGVRGRRAGRGSANSPSSSSQSTSSSPSFTRWSSQAPRKTSLRSQ